MTTTLAPAPAPAVARHQTVWAAVPDVMRSEWTKLRSVRSTYWTLLAAVVCIIGFSTLLSAIFASQYAGMNAQDRSSFNPTSNSLSGVFLAQLAIGVLGVLVITSEYGSGMIRSTIAAVPQRRMMLAAKATVFAIVTAVVGVGSCFAAFFIGQAILSGQGIQAHLGDPDVLRSIVGAGLYLPVLGLLALGIGTIIRHSAGAIAAVFGMLLVLPSLALLLPSGLSDGIGKFLPSNAGQAIIATGTRSSGDLTPWVGFGVFCLWAAVALGVASVLLQRRDA
jgi:ABC-2 type transport system permease protein